MHYLITSSNISEFGGVELEICLIAEALLEKGHSVKIVSKHFISRQSLIKEHFKTSNNALDITSAEELASKRLIFKSVLLGIVTMYTWMFNRRKREPLQIVFQLLYYRFLRDCVNNFWNEPEGINVIESCEKVVLVATPNNWNAGLIDRCNNNNKTLVWRMTQQAIPATLSNKYFSEGIKRINNSQVMVVHSRLNAQLMKDNWSLVKTPIIIDQFANNEELLLGIRPKNIENDFIIGTLARLDNEKGIDVVIKAVSEFKKRTPAVKLLIGGEGPEKERLMDMVRVLDLKEEVFFLGRLNQDQIAGFFGGINLFVISSLNESGPFTAIEAMAASVPIVSTRVGAMTSRLDGYEEFLFECGDVPGLLQRMELIYGLCSTGAIGDYQIELRKRYLSNYSRSAIIKQYLSILV